MNQLTRLLWTLSIIQLILVMDIMNIGFSQVKAIRPGCTNAYEPKLDFCMSLNNQYNPDANDKHNPCRQDCISGTMNDECGRELKRVESEGKEEIVKDFSFMTLDEAYEIADLYDKDFEAAKANFNRKYGTSDSEYPELFKRSPQSDCMGNCQAIGNFRGGVVSVTKLVSTIGRGAAFGACQAFCRCLPA